MKIDGNQIKIGNILEINSKLWRVTKTQHTQPGKGGAYLQVELKDIKDGTIKSEGNIITGVDSSKYEENSISSGTMKRIPPDFNSSIIGDHS